MDKNRNDEHFSKKKGGKGDKAAKEVQQQIKKKRRTKKTDEQQLRSIITPHLFKKKGRGLKKETHNTVKKKGKKKVSHTAWMRRVGGGRAIRQICRNLLKAKNEA